MSRPTKCRRVCHFPQTLSFLPLDAAEEKEPVILTVDEYEAIRLIDKEGLAQEQCALFMQIARTTVQRIYESARKKLADCIVEGRPLRIEGGEFWLCNGQSNDCGYHGCPAQKCYKEYKIEKGEKVMRIAATYENGDIFQHFGRTAQFKVYDVENGKIIASQIVDTNGSGHGALAGILSALKIDVLICGGIGGGAQVALAAANIKVCGGVSGSADAAAAAFAAGELKFDPNVQCNHHQHGEGHTCGEHGCGSHTCGNH